MHATGRILVVLVALLATGAPSQAGPTPVPKPFSDTLAAIRAAERAAWTVAHEHAARADDPLLSKFVTWLELLESREAPFERIAAFAAANPTWPRIAEMQRAAERAIRPDDDPAVVARWFAANPPRSGAGALAHLAALDRLGKGEEARALARRYWVSIDFGYADERAFHDTWRGHLARADHLARLDRLIWEGRTGPARQMLGRVERTQAALAEARLALLRLEPGVDGAIARVPADLREAPELWFERLRWRRMKGRDEDARAILFKPFPELPRPMLWAEEARILARRALSAGHYSEAARLVAGHRLSGGVEFAESEFLAGWIRLSRLQEPDAAARHFVELYHGVSFPISRARGAYWAGRAASAHGDEQAAREWYERAAEHATTFYGQRAIEALGRPLDRFTFAAAADDSAREAFLQRELVQLVLLLHREGANRHLRPFLLQLAGIAESASERLLVAQLARDLQRPREAIEAMKRAHQLDHVVAATGYPLWPIAPDSAGGTPETALLLSIIRQESAFDPGAVSGANARGMMQILPATARAVARRIGLPYDRDRLTSDPDYNIRLGTAYIAELLARYEQEPALALAAYNAGPGRVDRWLREFGDPRTTDIGLIDWIETVPFTETRSYVQRVMEAIPVYRFLLSDGELAQAPSRSLLEPLAN